MILNLLRTNQINEATIGQIFYQDKHVCYTLEDLPREVKIMHKTAIPAGTYDVIINYSNRFKRPMPRLLNVPGFEGILLHKGKNITSTSGCVLVGQSVQGDQLVNPIPAFEKIYNLITKGLKQGKVFIKIEDIPKKEIEIPKVIITQELPQIEITEIPKVVITETKKQSTLLTFIKLITALWKHWLSGFK